MNVRTHTHTQHTHIVYVLIALTHFPTAFPTSSFLSCMYKASKEASSHVVRASKEAVGKARASSKVVDDVVTSVDEALDKAKVELKEMEVRVVQLKAETGVDERLDELEAAIEQLKATIKAEAAEAGVDAKLEELEAAAEAAAMEAEGKAVAMRAEVRGIVTGKKRELAERIFDVTMKMFLRDNFIHADMHGGNMLIEAEEDNADAHFTVLDPGLRISLEGDDAVHFSLLIQAMCKCDVDGLSEHLLALNNCKFTDDQVIG